MSASSAKDGNRHVDAMRRGLQKGRRCLIIAGGFYEWQKVGIAGKQPYAITMGNRGIMAFAGLWEAWKDPAKPDAGWLRTCTIITTEPNEKIALVHDRMPVILGFEDWPKWLGEENANNNELAAAVSRLLKAFAIQVETRRRLRNGGSQFVRVEHVHVNEGGRAIIGNLKKT